MIDKNSADVEVQLKSHVCAVFDILTILVKRKRTVLGMPLLVGAIALVASMAIDNVYTATTKLLPPQGAQSTTAALLSNLGNAAIPGGLALGMKSPADLYVGMLKTRVVGVAIVERFQLRDVYSVELSSDALRRLQRLTTTSVGKDGLITLEVEDTDPKRAAAIANAYANEVNKLTKTMAISEASQRRQFFEKQVQETHKRLTEAEVAFRTTQETTGAIKLDDQGRMIIESIMRLRAEIASKEVQLASMRKFAAEGNPELALVKEQVSALHDQLTRLEKHSAIDEGQIIIPTNRVPAVGLQYIRRLRDVKYFEALHEFMAKQLEIAKLDEAREGSLIQVVDPAIPPERKTGPRRSLIVILASFIAAFVSVSIALVKEGIERSPLRARYRDQWNELRRSVVGGSRSS